MMLPSVDALAALIPDGALVAMPPDYSLPSCALARAVARRGTRGLRLLGAPILGYAADLLIGAGCVTEVETSAVTLGEAGFAPRFTAAVRAGSIVMRDATCPAIHTMLQAAEKGVPFMPIRGLIGSDILAQRPDWIVVPNPFAAATEQPGNAGEGDPIVLVPALRPDVALFHAPMADAHGNVWVGRRRELATMAHASLRTLVTVERVVEGNILEDERLAPGVISALYVEATAIAERGAWPSSGVFDDYAPDTAHMADYARVARTEDGFRAYLAREIPAAAAA